MYNFKKDVILFTPYYTATTTERQKEIDECLLNNIKCPHIKKLILMTEDNTMSPYKSDKIELLHIESRPTYKQWLELSSKYTNTISIMANSDVYFDDTLDLIHEALDTSHSIMCLTRYEKIGNSVTPNPNPKWTQDAWAVHTDTAIDKDLLRDLNITLGVPRCDNKLASAFYAHGWKVINPYKFIRTIHLHETQLRDYDINTDPRNLGTVAFIIPGEKINDEVTVELIYFCKKDRKTVIRFEVNDFINFYSLKKEQASLSKQTAPVYNDFGYIKDVRVNLVNIDKDSKIVSKFLTAGIKDVDLIYNSDKPELELIMSLLIGFLQTDRQHLCVLTKITDLNLNVIGFNLPPLHSFDFLNLGYVETETSVTEPYRYGVKCHFPRAFLINRRFAHEAVKLYRTKKFTLLKEIINNSNTKMCGLICKDQQNNFCNFFI